MSGVIMGGRRRTVVVLAAAVAVVVAAVVAFVALRGNGSTVDARPTVTSSSPAPSPSPTATPSPTPSSTLTPPVMPAAAKKRDQAGAEAFFRYFIDVYNYSFTALDTQPLEQISADECKFCRSAKATVAEILAKGARAEGGEVHVLASFAEPDASKAREVIVVASLRQDPGRTVGSDGNVTSSSSGSKRRLDALLRWEGGRWLLVGVETPT